MFLLTYNPYHSPLFATQQTSCRHLVVCVSFHLHTFIPCQQNTLCVSVWLALGSNSCIFFEKKKFFLDCRTEGQTFFFFFYKMFFNDMMPSIKSMSHLVIKKLIPIQTKQPWALSAHDSIYDAIFISLANHELLTCICFTVSSFRSVYIDMIDMRYDNVFTTRKQLTKTLSAVHIVCYPQLLIVSSIKDIQN